VWIPSQGSREAIEWCAAKERKYTYLQTFSPLKAAQKSFDMYRQFADSQGYEFARSQVGWACPIYVGDTDESARREFRPHIENFFNLFLRTPLSMRFPPGYASIASTKASIETKYSIRKDFLSIERLLDLGMIVCGSAATVREQLLATTEQLGVGTVIAMLQVATLPADLTEKNLRLFAREVMPALKAKDVSKPYRAAAPAMAQA
jgi:alkanesulfonate monooxygenase SsuD/methylene tetrahydromethanopterin reductase-like flavin-dependent oxidoreductase (luciferase family)